MTAFLLATLALAAVIVGLLVLPFLRRTPPGAAEHRAANLKVHRDRRRDLDAQYREGRLTDEEYAALCEDLEASLAGELQTEEVAEAAAGGGAGWWLPGALVAAVPVAAIALYAHWGFSDDVQSWVAQQQRAAEQGEAPETARRDRGQMLDELMSGLRQRLQSNPEDVDGWIMLGRSYRVLGRYDRAVLALQEGYRHAPERVELLALLVESRFLANDNRMDDGTRALLGRLKALEPDHPDALNLQAVAAWRQGEYARAAQYWERLLTTADLPDDERQPVANALARAQERSGSAVSIPVADTDSGGSAPAASASVTVQVELDDRLSERVSADDTVFVFARAEEGMPMPVAVARLQVGDLPATVTLDDAAAMTDDRPLSGETRVVAGARVSRSGSATRDSGDLEGIGEAVDVGADAATSVRIDTLVH